MQFDATFVVPSSNHFIEILPESKQVFFTLANGLIQSIRLPWYSQKLSGSEIENPYISLYIAAFA
jgi:hypothetical protein